jgi:quercetin dioxygenase-like cupin family protein
MAEPAFATTIINTNNAERFQSLRRELGVSAFGMNAVTLKPRQRGRIHSHDHQEEVFLVLEGELTLGVEGEEQTIAKHGLARVPAGVRRQLLNRGTTTLLLLALGGDGEHAGRDARAWEAWEDEGEGLTPQEVPLPADLPV